MSSVSVVWTVVQRHTGGPDELVEGPLSTYVEALELWTVLGILNPEKMFVMVSGPAPAERPFGDSPAVLPPELSHADQIAHAAFMDAA